jgi:hypothetical protein
MHLTWKPGGFVQAGGVGVGEGVGVGVVIPGPCDRLGPAVPEELVVAPEEAGELPGLTGDSRPGCSTTTNVAPIGDANCT